MDRDLFMEMKVLDPRVIEWGLGYKSKDAAGIDLYACIPEPLILYPQAIPVRIGTGIALHIKDPYFMGLIAPRSSTGTKGLVLANTIGIDDADYQGEIKLSAWNRNPLCRDFAGFPDATVDAITINPGDRIAQIVFMPIARAKFHMVQEFSVATERGEGGLGSTGVRG